jgi:hypothetical protein
MVGLQVQLLIGPGRPGAADKGKKSLRMTTIQKSDSILS